MKKYRRFGKWMMALGLTATLVACGAGEETVSEATDEPVVIEYWHANADTQGGLAVTELVEKFNASQDEVEVIPVYNSGMYQGLMQNLQSQLAAGNSPALVQIGWAYREYFVNNFHFAEPQTIIENYFPEDSGYLENTFADNFLDLAKSEAGDQIGLPYSVSTPVLFLNEDLLAEAGVSADQLSTWPEVHEAAKTIKEKTGKYGLYVSESNDNWTNQQIVESTGTKTIEDGKAAFATEGGIAAYKLWGDMIADKTALHASTDEGYQAFISGDVAMLHATIAQRTNVTENGQFNSTAIQVPGWEGEELKVPAGGALLAMTAQEEEQQKAAWAFMKFLYEADSVATWTEGTGYLPMTVNAVEENEGLRALIEEDAMFGASYSQMENLVPFASFPGANGLQASQVLLDMRDQIFSGMVSAEEAVVDAEKRINELLK